MGALLNREASNSGAASGSSVSSAQVRPEHAHPKRSSTRPDPGRGECGSWTRLAHSRQAARYRR
jgi:hypothetical protein